MLWEVCWWWFCGGGGLQFGEPPPALKSLGATNDPSRVTRLALTGGGPVGPTLPPVPQHADHSHPNGGQQCPHSPCPCRLWSRPPNHRLMGPCQEAVAPPTPPRMGRDLIPWATFGEPSPTLRPGIALILVHACVLINFEDIMQHYFINIFIRIECA